ncbi:CBS domain-containing protein [Actinosynnema sp. NPDC059797]
MDLMTTEVVVARPWTPVAEASRLPADTGLTTLPVVDRDGGLVGVVDEADLLRHRVPPDPRTFVGGEPADPLVAPAPLVADVMSVDVVTATPWTHPAALARLMLDRHVRVLPVVDRGRLVGVVARSDLLRSLARTDEVIAEDVRAHLDPHLWAVRVVGGEVLLTGTGDRPTAVAAVSELPGVAAVRVVGPGIPPPR